MACETILIVDDEEDLLELIDYNLTREGYLTIKASSGESALQKARAEKPELIILDYMLPGIDGLDVIKALKKDPATSSIPTVMLTARGDEADIVTSLELGADDYITKPFSPRILIARVRAILRRRTDAEEDYSDVLSINGLEIHKGMRSVTADGHPIDLTYTEFQILCFLASRPGWPFTRSQIVDAVHGDSYPVTDRSVDVQIVGLRKKLGERDKCIETVRGVGYRFKEST